MTVATWSVTESEDDLTVLARPSQSEKELLATYRSGLRRRQWLAVRALIYAVTGKRFQISYHPTGKPYIANSTLHLSISHSDDEVAISVNEKAETGLDLQHFNPKLHRIRQRFLNPEETARYEKEKTQNGADLYLHLIWSAKEAMYKIHGDNRIFFREHMSIKPFEIRPEGNLITGIISDTKRTETYDLRYECNDEWVLVYVLQ